MNILLIAPYYPWSDNPSRGSFNERSALALTSLGNRVEVLAPRPYAPPFVSRLTSRWASYRRMISAEVRNGIPVHRPPYLVIPRLGGAFWADPSAFFWCRRTVREMHQTARFDAIVSFDLVASGGLAWRIGRDLGIPSSGWAIGGDVLALPTSSHKRALLRAVQNLDLIFYQSRQLCEMVTQLLALQPDQVRPNRHVILSSGVPSPPLFSREQTRQRIRAEWGVQNDQIVVLNVARMVREKGVFELLDAMSLAADTNPGLVCVLVGSNPAFDETNAVVRKLTRTPGIRERVRLLPACSPPKVWEYLCAGDIFAFPSHREGMPNSLLEAMLMGLPAVATSIPPILEIEAATECIVLVPLADARLLAQAILRLAGSAEQRTLIGDKGRARVLKEFMLTEKMAEAVRWLARVTQDGTAASRKLHSREWEATRTHRSG